MIKVYNSFEGIREDWKLLYDNHSKSIFQSYEYNYISWEYKITCGNLYIITFLDYTNKIKAILPTYIDSQNILRFINDHGTDLCGMIYDSYVPLYDIMREICSHIRSQRGIEVVSLENLTCDSPILPYFKIFFTNSIVFSNNELSFLNCERSDDPISELKHLSNERRKKLKKVIKLSTSLDFKILKYKNEDILPIASLKEIANVMVTKGIRAKAYFNDAFWDYIIECYTKGLLEIAILNDANDKPISAGFVFFNDYVSVRWVILYTEAKYNLWNNILYIDAKGKEQRYVNSFGRGGYDYKMGNFKPSIQLLYRIIIPNRKKGILYCLKELFVFITKRYIRDSKLHSGLSELKICISNFRQRLWTQKK